MALTAKQEGFCQDFFISGNATQAYRNNYNTNGTENTINSEACLLLQNPKIAQRLKELRDSQASKYVINREFITIGVMEIIEQAKLENDRTNALKGYDMLSKLYDLNEDKQNDRKGISDKDRNQLLKSLRHKIIDVTP